LVTVMFSHHHGVLNRVIKHTVYGIYHGWIAGRKNYVIDFMY